MTEAKLQARLLRALRTKFLNFVVFKHSELISTGVPDISVNGRGQTTWLEVKVGRPGFNAKGLQTEVLLRLERAGCRIFYVVYREGRAGRSTEVWRPRDLTTGEALRSAPGFDHGLVVDFLEHEHGV